MRPTRALLVPALAATLVAAGLRLGAQEAPPPRLALVGDLVARVGPSVVRVETTPGRTRGDLPRRHLLRPVAGREGGSGLVVGRDLVVTHAALADAAAPAFTVTTARGQRVTASLLLLDARREVAVLQAADALDVPALDLAPAWPRTGEVVLALGDPFGAARDAAAAVTVGVVEGRTRLDAPESAYSGEVLLTSAAINPGSEGGALVDLAGRVVGLLAPLGRDRRSGALHGHAVPAEAVLAALAAARDDGPRLGLAARPVTGGLLVERVTPGGAAARAGVRAGDVLVRAGDVALGSPDALRAALAAGARRLVVVRDGAEVTLDLGGGR
ncbi:MAG: S1C family serine protease [Planctomycetes bacterium]|nr:S1C family serine protease [Planctomycetota bacterium]